MGFRIPEKGEGKLVEVQPELVTETHDGYSITYENGRVLFAFVGDDDGGRDELKPLPGGFYAPRGITCRVE